MSFASKTASNRANARASTGPKTAAAKARTAKNALRHGLSLPIHSDPTLSDEIEALAHEIAGPDPGIEIFERARRIAEAQIELLRVRRAPYALLSRSLADPNFVSREAMKKVKEQLESVIGFVRRFGPDTPMPPEFEFYPPRSMPDGPEKYVTVVSDISSQLSALDRYERRALSRRKFAIRNFDAARHQDNSGV